MEDKKQKRMIVHVNRLKKFNQREESSTVTSPNNEQINVNKSKEEEKQTITQTRRQ